MLRWIVHGVMSATVTAGIFGLLPRLSGLAHDAARRHTHLALIAGFIVPKAASLGSYALMYRRVLASDQEQSGP